MLHYQIEFDDYKQHLVHVTIRFLANPNQEIWLPTWIPGSYLIREFSKHIESVKAYDEAGRLLDIKKTSKNRWRLFNTDHELMTIEYDVYTYDLSVRGAYVDQTRLYINPACVCLALEGQEQSACEVEVFLPDELKHFQLATGLASKSLVKGRFTLKADNYDQLIDSPFELADQTRFSFETHGIEHEFVISGSHNTNIDRLKADIEKICAAEINMFGSAPFKDYTFMTMATGNSYGGLEHCNSTSLITPRDDLPKSNEPTEPSKDYQRFLGLCSHEYFHSWLVKFIRPENFANYNLHQEGYTSLLWIFEGFTSYYDDLILLRSGVISQKSYLDLLKAQIDRYLQNPGRFVQTVAESSFDAWIKFYRQDENSNNAGTSYYNKGSLVALCLDLGLRLRGSSLDALMRRLYENTQNGMQVNERTIFDLCKELTGDSWIEQINHLINTTDELPLDQLFPEFGLSYRVKTDKSLPLGLKLVDKPEGVLVQSARRDSAAAKAGISANDVIIAIDGLKATTKLVEKYAKQGGTYTVFAFRRDELLSFEVECSTSDLTEVELVIEDQAKTEKWLKA
ncbi:MULTISPECIES: M61 family metallopeptidase [Acinetobacter]|jgi:predicted metalloprotease with PDZ domain|uniref:Serine protease n=1 Tax=Acinetobacter pittii TaxID=48296 RepID=A0A242U2Z6_ACIPI|nr:MULTISPECIES: PDZ domain-containing protein [Acinetobacter]EXS25477.1 M61 glycyl aminopeptidase family protein [Acinetobacter baumannii 573719]MBJ8470269.1 M61 family metallopeptidase [Acinetobacter pittii]MBJ8500398.1 M61 family metallopeptidase [Acinetobacter pittii]MBJ9891140.1 M61 family metallopeptidase [Acinetobacter pittii]MCU4477682.1 M61 family metallopeptidase [Acinetobacter sp. WU_MDCI_Abxd143]